MARKILSRLNLYLVEYENRAWYESGLYVVVAELPEEAVALAKENEVKYGQANGGGEFKVKLVDGVKITTREKGVVDYKIYRE